MEFSCDLMLGKLAKWLRFLGFNTLYNPSFTKSQIIRISIKENRTFLTKDSSIEEYSGKLKYYFLKNKELSSQLKEILEEFKLNSKTNPFSICSNCNSDLEYISKDKIEDRLPEKVKLYFNDFRYCSQCDKLYWKGSHFERMTRFLEEKNIVK